MNSMVDLCGNFVVHSLGNHGLGLDSFIVLKYE